jgi:hypothetical protein
VALLTAPSLAFARGHGGGGNRSYSSHSSSHHSGGSKSVYVESRTRKSGSYASPHYRSSESHSTGGAVQRDSHGKIRRSAAAKADFRRHNPCPSTGRTTGSCPGYEVDHRTPLACGGADSPSNMQWLTTSENRHKGAEGCARR